MNTQLKERLAQLAIHVKAAQEAGKKAADECDNDRGTCNNDHIILTELQRVSEDQLVAAGIACYKRKAGRFALTYSVGGMANKNYVGVQAMSKHLTAVGVPHTIYYQMD